MTRRTGSRRWAIVSIALFAVALVICVAATVKAGHVAPVFSWPTPEGTDVVLTKRQYELALAARQVGRLAAAAAVVLALAAITLASQARKASRVR